MSVRLAKRLIEPDVWTCPHGVKWRPRKVDTYGPEVADIAAAAGLTPDPQQQLGLDLLFAIRPDGLPETFEFCVICCRQNLKTGLFKQAVLGWVVVLDEPDIVWSSHEMSTTREAQDDLAELFRADALNRLMMPTKNEGIYTENGEERIELTTGQRIWFKARTESGGRGLARRKLILDEAFALKPSMMGALIPTMLTKRGAQVLYGSSAGKADSAVLRDIRDRGKAHSSPRLTYLEWFAPREECADPDCDHPKDAVARNLDCALDRETLWLRANPTLSTGRITMEDIRDSRQAMPAEEFMRECLGWWDDPDAVAGPPAVRLSRWSTLARTDAPAPQRAAVVLDVEPDRSAASIGVAGQSLLVNAVGEVESRPTLVMFETRPGYAWVANAVKQLRENLDVLEVALHPSSQAKLLLPALRSLDIEPHRLTIHDLGAGCSGFQTAIEERTIVHLGQAELDAAVAVARIRTINETELWDRKKASVPLGPLVATSTAQQRWALLAAENPPPPPPAPRRARQGGGTGSTPGRRARAGSIQSIGF